ncbi:MAG: helix-hairpin-helix domain-containing protein [Bacteroidia bacterium]
MKKEDTKQTALKELQQIPGVGISIANDLWNIHIKSIDDLKFRDPEELYRLSNEFAGVVQDRCLLYVFRCAVYYATEKEHEKEKLKWWNWKEIKKIK